METRRKKHETRTTKRDHFEFIIFRLQKKNCICSLRVTLRIVVNTKLQKAMENQAKEPKTIGDSGKKGEMHHEIYHQKIMII